MNKHQKLTILYNILNLMRKSIRWIL